MGRDKALDRLVDDLRGYLEIESGKTFKQEEQPLEAITPSFRKKKVYTPKIYLRLKPVLMAASIIIAVIVFFINQWTHNPETNPVKNTTETAKLTDTNRTEKNIPIKAEPDFIRDLKLKGWDVIKNENDFWEAYYKAYDLTMIHIPPGKFMMGADNGDRDEKPPHEVELDGYWIGKYEVTFAQYDRYCEDTGKEKPGDKGWGRGNRPVINVSWDDAGAYCRWLSKKIGFTFQLPTEAQWEKAARGVAYPWNGWDDYVFRVVCEFSPRHT